MKWDEMKARYSCNDCWYSMQNCHDATICCEMEDGLCDYFELADDAREDEEK